MSDNFKAIVINQEGENFTKEVKELNLDFLNDEEVLVKIDFSDLNFKDALILKDGGKLVKEFPRIPGIDFSGTVVDSKVDEFKKDEKVILTGSRVGEIYHGGYSQFAKVKKEFLIKSPENINNRQAMIIGTAGFTALLCAFAVKAREEILLGEKVNNVLVTGSTGGVGSIAVMVLSKLGCEVTAMASSEDKLLACKEYGADNLVLTKKDNLRDSLKDFKEITFDIIYDTVGGTYTNDSLRFIAWEGKLLIMGLFKTLYSMQCSKHYLH